MTWTRFVTLVAAAALAGVVGLSVLVVQLYARIAALEQAIPAVVPIALVIPDGPEETTAERRARLQRDVDRTVKDLEWLLRVPAAPTR